MKKIFALGWMLVAALALTNCSKEETVAPTLEQDFVVYANLDATRTVADGYSTSWADGDNLNIFHAVAGEETATYVSDGEFTLNDVAAGTFTGTVTGVEDGTSYDWYAIYPYSSYNKTPDNAGYMTIAALTQEQAGINNTTHTSGAPLYGVVKGGSSVAPEFSMKHLSSMIKVNVTNVVDEAVSIKSILVETAGTKITGTYYVDITGDTPAYTSSGDSYTYTSAQLNVTGEVVPVQPNETAAFYLMVRPFEVAEGATETITVTVTDNSDDVSVREYTIPAGKGFAPGKVTTLNFDFAADGGIEWTTIADIHAASAEGTFNIQNATVVLKLAKSCLLKDATGYLYSYQTLDVNEGDIVNIMNATTSTYGERQIKSGATVEVVGATTVEHPVATEIADGAAFSTLATSYTVGDYVTVEASKITVGSKYINFYVDGASYTGSLVAPMEDLSQYNNLPVKITGYAGYLTNSYFYLFPTKVETLPYLQVESSSLAWEASDLTAKTVAIDTDNDWSITSAPAWVEAVHTDAATLTVTPTEEGPADGRSGVIELAHIANPAITATVTVIQNASEALDTYAWTLASGELGTQTTPAESVLKGTPEMTWNMAYTWNSTAYLGWDANNGRGVQIGSGSKPVTTFSISTTDFTSKVSKVTVNAATASSGNCTIAVTVGGVALTCSSTKLTTTATDYEFVAATPITGEIIITYTNSASKAVYLGSIKINE